MLSLKKVTLGISAIALAMLSAVAPANAMPSPGDYGALVRQPGCSETIKELHGRVIYLWNCDNSYHAQIANASKGDRVWLRGDSAGDTAFATVPDGETSANTSSRGPEGGPWHACGAADNRTDEVCT